MILALGLGVNLMLGSILHQHFLRPHDAPNPEQLLAFHVGRGVEPQEPGSISAEAFLTLSRQSRCLSHLGVANSRRAILDGGDEIQEISAKRLSASAFPLLGLPAYFQPEDDREGGTRKLVLSHKAWIARYGSDPDILKKTIRLDGLEHRVVGILPKGFRFPATFGSSDFILNLALTSEEVAMRQVSFLNALGRMQKGVSREAAQAELGGLYEQIERDRGQGARFNILRLIPQRDSQTPHWRSSIALLGACGLFVLLITCANVANLSLARWIPRARELSLRSALGASRVSALAPLLLETLCLAMAGGTMATLLHAFLGPILSEHLDLRVAENVSRLPQFGLLFAMVIFSALLLALPVFWSLRRVGQITGLNDHARGTGSRSHGRMRSSLVVIQVAATSCLLVLSMLLMQSLHALSRVKVGFDPGNVLTATFRLPPATFNTREAVAAFEAELVREANNIPGVRAAAITDSIPMNNSSSTIGSTLEKQDGTQVFCQPLAYQISGDYFKVMGIPLLAGRLLEPGDLDGCIINEHLARQAWGSPHAAILRSITCGRPLQVIGVVGDSRHHELRASIEPQIYSLRKTPSQLQLVLKGDKSPESLVAPLRERIKRLAPGIPTNRIQPMARLMERQTQESKSLSLLFGATAGLALVLALLGIGSALALTVAQRRSEIGMRMALGAQVSSIIAMILRQGLFQIGLGLAIGLPLALMTGKLLQNQLYAVQPGDPRSLLTALILLGICGLSASLIPALRAARIQPMEALRGE